MTYQVLARKWRPQKFAEIVGQEHITRTLQNAIAQERVGHAYLFVGSRGIGKTTTARIFAKALNCEARAASEPCGECQSCREIAGGSSLDVIEIDGASHNKVEHIRELRENVQYTPSRSRYKIYIIDEVHMLTPAAWNALLKTLEEPPPHVKFFFATTEPHKVLPTIVSRCQRFDLKRIAVGLIAERLKGIAIQEGVAIEARALVAIARAADGGMRDAQSIFDQIIAFCGGGDSRPICEDDVINVFGLASGQELMTLAAAILNNDIPAVIGVVHGLADRGRDLERVLGDLIYFVRNVMIQQLCREAEQMLDVSEAELTDLRTVAGAADPALVQRALEGLTQQERFLRSALNKRVYLEVALIRVMHEVHSVQIDDVIARLNRLREVEGAPEIKELKRVEAGTEPPRPAPPSRPVVAPPVAEAPKATPPTAEPPTPEPAAPAVEPAPAVAKEAATPDPPPEAEPEAEPQDAPMVAEGMPTWGSARPEDLEERAIPSAADEAQAVAAWQAVIEAVGKVPEHRQLKTCMQALRPVNFWQGRLQVGYESDCPKEHLELLQESGNVAIMEEALQAACRLPSARLSIKRWVEGVSNGTAGKRLVSSPAVREKVEANPFVQEVLTLFDGELIDVRG